MGCYEEWAHPDGFYPNGLLPNEEASVTRFLDPDRWLMAEERTAELIACIQPNQLSEERRNAVASYVQRLITRCFSCQEKVFTFGSVPLKTYLPDGDIDLTAFGKNESLKDTWANEVRDMLMNEEKSEDAEFRVKEVQYIQAEVKIIKCLVDNIVVDISFNQLGGLCTLCFLEEVDSLVKQNHLFKRSIILIKAWCYYESRILGAHHGLISTYALETLVLYIFHVFNNSFAGPLEVLYRFLEFFSKFDWDNFCVSLWGPVPINSLPDMTAAPPRKDGGALLLSKVFLDACSSVYSVFPSSPENHELPFISKHFNVIDPLRANNNLGRSVSKGNFFRIRSAFAFGAQRLARLLDCPKENIIVEVNQFFMNTLDRHGKGHRPDAPSPEFCGLRPVNINHIDGSNDLTNSSSSKNAKENSASHESEVEKKHTSHTSHGVLSQHGNQFLKRLSRPNNVSLVSHAESQKTHSNLTSFRGSDQNHQMTHTSSSNESVRSDSRPDYLGNEVHARYQFARTHSSPELTGTSYQFSSQGRHNRASETIKGQIATRLDYSTRRNLGTEVSENSNAISSTEDLPSSRWNSYHQQIHASVESNCYHGESGLGPIGEDRPSVAEAMRMQQEEQDFVNMMASSNVHMPVNLASAHQPVPMSPSVLTSLGYAHGNPAGIVPPWGPNMHYSQGLVSLPISQYFSNIGMTSNQEEIVEPIDDNLVARETYQEDSDHGFWSERDVDSLRGFDVDNGSFPVQRLNEKKQFTSGGYPNSSSPVSSLEKHSTKARSSIKDNRGFIRENSDDNPQHQNISGNDVYSASSKFFPASHATSRFKQSSEASLDGSSSKISRSTRDRKGRKSPSADRSTFYENGWQYESESVDHVSSKTDDDNGDWIPLSTTGTEVAESTVLETVSSSLVRTHEIPDYEPGQLSVSKSMLPIAPILANSGSRQRTIDKNGMLPWFYPTGPPVPFVTMLPFYGFPTEKGTSDSSTSHIDRGEGFNNHHSSQSNQRLDSTENLDEPDTFSCSSSAKGSTSVEPSEEHKSDILNSDFASHWQNLQYGRFCQDPRDHGPMFYPPSVVVPPMYMQGHFPWDSPGRPLSANASLFTQLMGYGPRMYPVSPLQSGTNRPLSGYRHYGDDAPRYRGGTGTYLPNPKVAFRDRHSSSGRNRGNYSHDRNDHHGDREGNWNNNNSKQRFSGRGRGRNQVEKPNTRIDRNTTSNSRSDRPSWNAFKPDSFPSNHSQNSPFSSSNSMHRGSSNVAYGMYPLQMVNPDGVSPGTAGPPFFMLYPYDQNMVCGGLTEQFEFGSLGTVHFSGTNEVVQVGEGSSKSINVQQNFHVDTAQSSPDKPSSPKFQR
ncbi:hypothetical protein ACSBR1_008604 [Camellia fascicularis]